MELNINEKNIVLKFGPVTNPTTLSYYSVKPKKPVEGETGRRLKVLQMTLSYIVYLFLQLHRPLSSPELRPSIGLCGFTP